MAKRTDVRQGLPPIRPLWSPEPITLCALFSCRARLTPKVQVLLDLLAEYIDTDRDPRLEQDGAKGYFTYPCFHLHQALEEVTRFPLAPQARDTIREALKRRWPWRPTSRR